MHTIPSVDRRVLTYGVEVLNRGQDVPLAGVACTLLPAPTKPTRTTTWELLPVVDDEVQVTVAGPDAPDGDGFVLPRGSYRLYLQASDNPETITEPVDVVIID